MRITEAARRLGTSARMLRYREDLGLLPQVRDAFAVSRGAAHRVFSEEDLSAVAAALELERRYDISPAALAFGVRVLAGIWQSGRSCQPRRRCPFPGPQDPHPAFSRLRPPALALINFTMRKRSWWIRLIRSAVVAIATHIHRRSPIHRASGADVQRGARVFCG